VVSDPADVDFAMIMGTGWAHFAAAHFATPTPRVFELIARLRDLGETAETISLPARC